MSSRRRRDRGNPDSTRFTRLEFDPATYPEAYTTNLAFANTFRCAVTSACYAVDPLPLGERVAEGRVRGAPRQQFPPHPRPLSLAGERGEMGHAAAWVQSTHPTWVGRGEKWAMPSPRWGVTPLRFPAFSHSPQASIPARPLIRATVRFSIEGLWGQWASAAASCVCRMVTNAVHHWMEADSCQ